MPLYSHNLPQIFLCDTAKRECWMNQCEKCKDGKGFIATYPLEELSIGMSGRQTVMNN